MVMLWRLAHEFQVLARKCVAELMVSARACTQTRVHAAFAAEEALSASGDNDVHAPMTEPALLIGSP